jgi:hypothetical protein
VPIINGPQQLLATELASLEQIQHTKTQIEQSLVQDSFFFFRPNVCPLVCGYNSCSQSVSHRNGKQD